MSESLLDNAKYAEWKDEFTFDTCKLNRKAFSEFLLNYMLGEESGFVLNIDASWGAGKTEFLKRVYIEALKKNHPTIYIDAWESDFSKDPLLVVTSELVNQLEAFNGRIGKLEDFEKFKEYTGKIFKTLLIGIAGLATKHLVGDGGVGTAVASVFLNEEDKSLTSMLASGYEEQISAIHNIKTALTQLAEVLGKNYNFKTPVLVLIDELDRCRPTYAIEMLEVIKHFFKIEHFVFVVATDTKQMQESIKAVYGTNFDSPQYLKRFFDRVAHLPTPDIDTYIAHQDTDIHRYLNMILYPRVKFILPVDQILSLIYQSFKLQTRDIDQINAQLHACLRTLNSSSRKTIVNWIVLLAGLIEKHLNIQSFYQRTKLNRQDIDGASIKSLQFQIRNKFSSFQTNNLINLSFSSIEFHSTGNSQNAYPHNYEHFDIIDKNITDELKKSTMSEFYHMLENMHKIDAKFLSWDDYKSCIEYAGYIR
ncbi:KAP P-loop domain protein [Shewanella sp. W3-18-1]|uniref:KAP family P-loop NTPase fold protein n=1 Tax=Shewanella sp. (strain W3-18-1) TaxID=351745 RepID=UPI00005FDB05|nr:P-loop NTPase fold protein [Shewanella sp. W3-18-1]ABM25734.1 KAP P-loop domain protein [Shewanella sp. W3-18-1]